MHKEKIIIGTRGSLLALKQTEIILNKLKTIHPEFKYEIKKIKTSGDKNLRVPLQTDSLKRFFVKELEYALLEKKIDIAVHSLKDMPVETPEEFLIGAIPEREDNRDVLLSNNKYPFKELRSGSVIGTCSLRRSVQILDLRPDLKIKEIRGNITTRIKKLEYGQYDALVLAYAGLKRVGLINKICEIFDPFQIMPAPGQGALCVQCMSENYKIRELAKDINNEEAEQLIIAEREFSKIFGGGCKTPIGASARIIGNQFELSGMYAVNGKIIKDKVIKSKNNYKECVKELELKIKKKIHD